MNKWRVIGILGAAFSLGLSLERQTRAPAPVRVEEREGRIPRGYYKSEGAWERAKRQARKGS